MTQASQHAEHPHPRTDGELAVSTGNGRTETRWKPRQMLWSELVAKLKEPVRTTETIQEYRKLSKAEQDDRKDVGGYVGGALKGGVRKVETVAFRSLVTLDADFANPYFLDALEFAGFACVAHSTRKHSDEKPRWRLVIPLSSSVTPDKYQAIARKVAELWGMETWDETTYETHRLMYWPSVSADQEYHCKAFDGPWLNPDEVLAQYGPGDAWKDAGLWPRSKRIDEALRVSAAKAGNPLEKPGVVGAFCRAYGIEDAIAEHLQDVYAPGSLAGRYTYLAGSSANGVIIYEGLWAYSHHATDPSQGRLCNAWDLTRIQKFGAMDGDAKEGTPVNRLPSHTAMSEWARELPPVKRILADAQRESLRSAFQPVENWRDQLKFGEDGKVRQTREMARLILTHDENLAGLIRFNLLDYMPNIVGDLPWRKLGNETEWSDADEANLNHYLELNWNFTATKSIQDASLIVVTHQAFHPVREYLQSLSWDGTPRLDRMLVSYLGAEDIPYTHAVTRKVMVAAVARVMTLGCKFDHVLTLYGKQGTGKSTLVDTLGGQWATDSFATVSGKEAFESIQGVWFVEAPEMSSIRRAEAEAVKHFFTKRNDRYRSAYARYTKKCHRQCIFIASTNDPQMLVDPTGNRRFWIMPVKPPKHASVWQPELAANRDQLFAEAYFQWAMGENLYLPPDLEAEAERLQREHTLDDGLSASIEEWLKQPVPSDWYSRNMYQRQAFLNGAFEASSMMLRDRVCAKEVWVEHMGGRPDQFNEVKARSINNSLRRIGWVESATVRLGPYGRTRGFMNLEAAAVPF
ncbi:putative DNA primase/helicase [Gammaproteobacteria bacterium]